jgi:acyl-coenzyme A synthetase/AMP-(fatty) acid ligase
MKILVIDGMGGGIGKAVIEHIKAGLSGAEITAVGTNSIAASAMLKAGADYGATGENAVIYNCAKADFIIGVTGIVFANAMHGEISPKMAEAVSSSSAHKILLPLDKCNVTILGVDNKPIQSYINEIAAVLKKKILESQVSLTTTTIKEK